LSRFGDVYRRSDFVLINASAFNYNQHRENFMETRIRYKRNQDNTLTSNKSFDLNGRQVQITIDLVTHSYKVTDFTTGESLKSGSDKNPACVKKAAKNALASLGYNFTNESRNRGPNAVTESTTAA
jgi:hypothetical protein